MNKQDESKPHIVLLRKWDDGVYYKCSDKRVETYGSTPKEAFEMWKIISDTTAWRIEYAPYHPAMKDQYHATRMQPFSLLKYAEISYSSNSVPLK